jgi:hypothetical protein
VWSWVPPAPVPAWVAPVPVVGFEIESGWKIRKHVKGDLLNLRDAGVALSVIGRRQHPQCRHGALGLGGAVLP